MSADGGHTGLSGQVHSSPMATTPTSTPTHTPAPDGPRRRSRSEFGLVVVVLLVIAAVALRPALAGLLRQPAAANWATVFVAVTIQAMPFLVLGVTVSGAIAAFVPPGAIARLLPRRPALAGPAPPRARPALPGCEGGS